MDTDTEDDYMSHCAATSPAQGGINSYDDDLDEILLEQVLQQGMAEVEEAKFGYAEVKHANCPRPPTGKESELNPTRMMQIVHRCDTCVFISVFTFQQCIHSFPAIFYSLYSSGNCSHDGNCCHNVVVL